MKRLRSSSTPLTMFVMVLALFLAKKTSAQPTYNFYRVPLTEGCRAHRDLRFYWSNTYAVPPLNRPLVPGGGGQNDLDRFGRSLTEEYGNPFGFPMTDAQIVYDYLQFPNLSHTTYDTACANPGFLIPPYQSFPAANYMDTYIYAPAINRSPTSPWYEPDLSIPTGCYDSGNCSNYGWWPHNIANNRLYMPGPIPSMVGVTGPNAWTRQSSMWSGIWNHEFQHAFNIGQPGVGGTMSEVFSSAAQAIAGDKGDGRFDHDVPYTRSLFETNYEGWRGFTAYLASQFRGADTTFAGRSDDLLWRWAHGTNKQITGLSARLNDAECAECPAKAYLAGRTGHDRLQIIMQNWRVATYVNQYALAGGQYGFPPQFDFVPTRDVGNWRDINTHPLAINSLVIPPEVTLTKGNVTREAVFTGMRYTPASAGGLDSTEMSLAAFGAEYWVVKAGPDARDANRTLVARITPLGTVTNCNGFDGRLMATLVAYNAPPDSLVNWNNLWKHPEWAVSAIGPIEMDVDSIRGNMEIVLPTFGQTHNAVLVTMSLAEAPIGSLVSASPLFSERILPYSISFGLRTTPFLAVNPVALLTDTSATDSRPAWNPAGDEVVFVRLPHGSISQQIMRKKTDATPAQPLFTMSPTSRVYFVDWSPRGDWVAYDYSPNSTSSWDIWAYNIQTQENRRLTTYFDADVFPSFSPNGQSLVYWRYVGGGATPWSVRKVNLNGTGDVQLAASLYGPGGPARWSPDGLTIHLIESGGSVKAVPAGGGTTVVKPEFGTPYGVELSPGDGKALVDERGTIPNCTNPNTPFARVGLRDLAARKTDVQVLRSARRAQFPRYARNGTHVAFDWSPDNDPATDYDLYYGTVTFNHAPVFSPACVYDQTTGSCVEFVRNLSATDPDGEPVTFKISQAPAGMFLQGGNQIRWTPDNSQLGDHFIALRAIDGSGGADWRVIKITVEDIGWCEFECPPGHECYPARAVPSREGSGIPTSFALEQNLPNPFRDETVLRFAIPHPANVALDIIDVQGRLVRSVTEGPMGAGYFSLAWDRRDNQGHQVGPGIYFYRMRAGSFVARRKMVLLP